MCIVASLVVCVCVPLGCGVRIFASVFCGVENIASFFRFRVISATVVSRSFLSPRFGRGLSDVPEVGLVGNARRENAPYEGFGWLTWGCG